MVNFRTSKTTEKSIRTPRRRIETGKIRPNSAIFGHNGQPKGKCRSPLPPHFYGSSIYFVNGLQPELDRFPNRSAQKSMPPLRRGIPCALASPGARDPRAEGIMDDDAGVEVVSRYVTMGAGQVVALRAAGARLREVNRILENTAWGSYRTGFCPTWDYKAIGVAAHRKVQQGGTEQFRWECPGISRAWRSAPRSRRARRSRSCS
jgi:hypothetical protein